MKEEKLQAHDVLKDYVNALEQLSICQNTFYKMWPQNFEGEEGPRGEDFYKEEKLVCEKIKALNVIRLKREATNTHSLFNK